MCWKSAESARTAGTRYSSLEEEGRLAGCWLPVWKQWLCACCCWALLGSGCAPLLLTQPKTETGKSPLKSASATADAVTLEVLFARFPLGQADMNGTLWNDIDEQHLDIDLRRRLAANGIRAGLIGTNIPEPIARLIHYTAEALPDEPNEKVPLDKEPIVRRRLIQVRDGGQSEILATGQLPELPLLVKEGDALGGKTFRDAQGLFMLYSHTLAAGGLQLDLTPEIRHGDTRQQWNGADGVFKLEMARDKQVYESLRTSAVLTPGQMLVVSCLPDRPGSLGYQFFTDETTGSRQQKVLLIRVAQLPPEALYIEE